MGGRSSTARERRRRPGEPSGYLEGEGPVELAVDIGPIQIYHFHEECRAEVTRALLRAGHLSFEDTRYSNHEWEQARQDTDGVPGMCFGCLPVLTHGDFILAQSQATAFYAAELGIWAKGRIGTGMNRIRNRVYELMFLGVHAELQGAMFKCHYGSETFKRRFRDRLPESVRNILVGIERMILSKAFPGPYLLSPDGPTVADFCVHNAVSSSFPGLRKLGVDLSGYPAILRLTDAVQANLTTKERKRARDDPPQVPLPQGLPELWYFDSQGQAEITRLAFAAGGVQFRDIRLTTAQWRDVKNNPNSVPSRLFKNMPCLRHGDILLAQPRATCVYAAELGIWAQGRIGTGPEAVNNRAIELMVLGVHADLQTSMFRHLMGGRDSGENTRASARSRAVLDSLVHPLLQGLERLLERKTCQGPFFICEDGPTLADLAVFDAVVSPLPGLQVLMVDLEPYERIRALVEAVGQDRRISHYANTRGAVRERSDLSLPPVDDEDMSTSRPTSAEMRPSVPIRPGRQSPPGIEHLSPRGGYLNT